MNRPSRPNKRIKVRKIHGSFQKVLDAAFIQRPPGEDFFVFTVITDDPDLPTHDLGYSIMGSWEASTRSLVSMMDSMAMIIRPNQVAMRQGDKAREYLKLSMREEIKYQNERNSVPNN